MQMYEYWSSLDVQSARTTAFKGLEDMLDANQKHAQPTRAVTLREDNKKVWESLGTVKHFLVDLSILIDRNLLNRDLAIVLFSSTLTDWFRLLQEITWDDTTWETEFKPGITRLFEIMRDAKPTWK